MRENFPYILACIVGLVLCVTYIWAYVTGRYVPLAKWRPTAGGVGFVLGVSCSAALVVYGFHCALDKIHAEPVKKHVEAQPREHIMTYFEKAPRK